MELTNGIFFVSFFWQKVRTMKIRTSKTKKNIENESTHQNYESHFDHFVKSLPWIPRHVGGQVRVSQVTLGYVTLSQVRLSQVIKFLTLIFQCQNTIGRFYLLRITYGYQGPWGVRLGSASLSQVRLGWVRLGQVRLCQVRLYKGRLNQFKKA